MPEPFVLLNDLPASEQEPDLLGASEVAANLAALIHASRDNTPFVLAVEGRWGAGKSTLMGRLSAALKQRENIRVVDFNAWTASGVSALTGMLRLVLEEVDPSLVRRSLRQARRNGLVGGFARIGVTMVARLFGVDRAIDELWQRMSVDAAARAEARQLLEGALTSWTERTDGAPRRTIVVFVDDLDRCEPATVIQICEAIKLYLDLPGMVFVLGCDLGVLSRLAIPVAHEPDEMRRYLEKIIQVSYRIPAPTSGQLQRMIEDYAYRSRTDGLLSQTMVNLIARQSGGNPRKIKRLINSFVTEYQLDAEWRAFGAQGLLHAVVMQHFYADFYQSILDARTDLVSALLDYKEVRDELRKAPPVAEAARPRVNALLSQYGVGAPGPSEEDLGRTLTQLDERVPKAWLRLVDNTDFIDLLRGPGAREEFVRLQERLRRTPLSTSPSPTQTSRSEPRLNGLRLLWVDDNPRGNAYLVERLESRGAAVQTAVDRESAVIALRSFGPNALISDVVRYGEAVGFDDLAMLRGAGFTGPAYFYTSRVRADQAAKAQEVGADGITASPGALLDWLEHLHALLPR